MYKEILVGILIKNFDFIGWQNFRLYYITGVIIVLTIYYTITDFCRSEYEFLLTCKIILTESFGFGQYWFCRSIKTHIHWYKSM